MSTQPLVSIGIPAYKGAAFIKETIESVLAQSFRDFELIICDDNSPDDTLEVIAGFTDPRIRVLRSEANLGAEGNWNRCLSEARGKYFKLLPQDDRLLPGCLERQVAVLEADTGEAISLVFSARQVVLPNGKPAMVRGYPAAEGRVSGDKVITRCVRAGTNLVGEPGSGLFRRSLASRIGDYDAANPYVVDLDYWFRLLREGDAYYIALPMVTFTVSAASWSFALGNRQSADFEAFLRRFSTMPGFRFSRLDMACGRWMARLNNCLRLLFYRLVLN